MSTIVGTYRYQNLIPWDIEDIPYGWHRGFVRDSKVDLFLGTSRTRYLPKPKDLTLRIGPVFVLVDEMRGITLFLSPPKNPEKYGIIRFSDLARKEVNVAKSYCTDHEVPDPEFQV